MRFWWQSNDKGVEALGTSNNKQVKALGTEQQRG